MFQVLQLTHTTCSLVGCNLFLVLCFKVLTRLMFLDAVKRVNIYFSAEVTNYCMLSFVYLNSNLTMLVYYYLLQLI